MNLFPSEYAALVEGRAEVMEFGDLYPAVPELCQEGGELCPLVRVFVEHGADSRTQ